MAEYIEREAAIESFRKNLDGGYVLTNDAQTTHILQSLPAADVVPVVRGKWIDDKVSFYRGCSECGCFLEYAVDTFLDYGDHYNYCPNCGAKMEES